MSARLSIIVTNYNHGRFLEESIARIFGQTQPPDEVLVVDDASTDNSHAVIASLVERYPTLRVLQHEKNLGVNAALNNGVAACTGDFFSGVGADDPLLPNFVASAKALLARHPETRFLCAEYCSLEPSPTGPVLRSWQVKLSKAARFFSPTEIAAVYRSRTSLSVPTAPAVWERHAWVTAGRLQPKLGWLADWFAALVVMSRHGAGYIPEVSQAIRYDARSHQHAGQANLDGVRALLRVILEQLSEPAYDDVRFFFAIPSVFARFGFKILHLLAHDTRFVEYLSAGLMRNAIAAEGLPLIPSLQSMPAAPASVLAPKCRSILAYYAAVTREQARQLAAVQQLDRAHEFYLKSLAAQPDDGIVRRGFADLNRRHCGFEPLSSPASIA